MNGIQIRVQGTEEQFKQMTGQCELIEALFAQTLARRIDGLKAEESIEFILSWFQSVRHMSQAALMSSGIKTQVHPLISSKFRAALDEEHKFQEQLDKDRLVAALNKFIQESWSVTPNSAQLARLRGIIYDLPSADVDGA